MPKDKKDFKIICAKCAHPATTHDTKEEYKEFVHNGQSEKYLDKRIITFTHQSGKRCIVVARPDVTYLT